MYASVSPPTLSSISAMMMIGLERKFSAPLDRERGMRRFSKLFRIISPEQQHAACQEKERVPLQTEAWLARSVGKGGPA